MTLRFRYCPIPVPRPAVALGGRYIRPRPLVAVTLFGPASDLQLDALLDPGADDTIFPELVAAKLGIDLSQAPSGRCAGVGAPPMTLRYAALRLRLSDGQSEYEWPALVGFMAAPLRCPLLGFAGCLQFFTATFFGDREQVELDANALYPGT